MTAIRDPYATHQPVLRALGQAVTIRRVLELGAGLYSTPLWCDRTAFPTLVRVDSLETSWDWLIKVQALGGDVRLHLQFIGPHLLDWLDDHDLDGYDLIFIDNGASQAERIPVIEAISRRQPRGLVVIHDYEQPAYQQAAQGWDYQRLYREETPWTAVLWNGERAEMETAV